MSVDVVPTSESPDQLVVRFNKTSAFVMCGLGLAWFAASFFVPVPRYQATHNGMIFGSVALLSFGVPMALRRPYVLINPRMVKVRSQFFMRRRFKIDGLGDLAVNYDSLIRRSDGKTLADLSRMNCDPADVANLKRTLGTADRPAP